MQLKYLYFFIIVFYCFFNKTEIFEAQNHLKSKNNKTFVLKKHPYKKITLLKSVTKFSCYAGLSFDLLERLFLIHKFNVLFIPFTTFTLATTTTSILLFVCAEIVIVICIVKGIMKLIDYIFGKDPRNTNTIEKDKKIKKRFRPFTNKKLPLNATDFERS